MLEKLEKILEIEKVGSPLHAWASAQIEKLPRDTRSPQEIKLAQMNVQIRAMSWQKREQNL